jgi:exopolyphosphatase/guanosine-5'-triphosphate,3'-diphosphate pyrophosphatase
VRSATIDVGTSSILLLVLDGDTVLEDRARVERLGEGVDRAGRLAPAAVARALDALREYAAAIARHGVDRVAAVGTQALREVENAEDFLGPAREILGVPIEIIDGRREAELAAAAVRASFPELREVLIADVGGGSTELIHVGAASPSIASLRVGSVRMAERHLRTDPPTAAEAAAMIADIDAVLAGAEVPSGVAVVGVAGTVTTLAAVALRLDPYDGARVHGLTLERAEVERQLALYLRLPLAERLRIPGLHPKRADVIAGGAAVVARLLARAGAPSLRVSDRGVRWGLAAELLG